MPYAVVVDWYGPYGSVAAARAAIREEGFQEVLYMAAGTVGREKIAKLQYVGITGNFGRRMKPTHKIREFVSEENLSLYIGDVSSQKVSGRKARHQHKSHSVPVNLAESALAFFMQLPLNINKRCSRPGDSIVLINRWWKTDFETRFKRRPFKEWPDYIEYDEFTDFGMVARHGKRRESFDSDRLDQVCRDAKAALRG